MHTKCANIIIIGLKYHHFATESIIAIFNAINATYECCILGITAVPREIENNAYAKCLGLNKVHYGRCASGELYCFFVYKLLSHYDLSACKRYILML